MDLTSIIRRRLKELGIEQRELAKAADVTESYISQLLTKKKTPPAPDRTGIYEKIARVLKLSAKHLATLAAEQRREQLRRSVIDPPRPLHQEFRELILRKCAAEEKEHIECIFEREPFGELERFVARQLLDVSKRAVNEEWEDPKWRQRLARAAKRGTEETRASIFEFLEADVFHVSLENCLSLLDPLIEHWAIDLESFGMAIALNPKLVRKSMRTLSFKEEDSPKPPLGAERGFEEFLHDEKLSGDITETEATFLSALRFDGKRPSALYFYRELQNMRDPLNFCPLDIIHQEEPKVRLKR